jgi:hypothetical protein
MLSRGTVKLSQTYLFKIGTRFRLELRLQAGEGSMFDSVSAASAIDIAVPLGTVPTDSVAEAALEFVDFADRQQLQSENSPEFRPPKRTELRPCTWHGKGGRTPGVLPWAPVPCVECRVDESTGSAAELFAAWSLPPSVVFTKWIRVPPICSHWEFAIVSDIDPAVLATPDRLGIVR